MTVHASGSSAAPPTHSLVTPAVAIHLVAVGAWVATVVWAIRMDMGTWGMPGTMGMSFGAFLLMWTLMMAAMMLSATAPLATLYSRTITTNRVPRLTAFVSGYLVVWAATGVVAWVLADVGGELAADHRGVAQGVAVGAFAAAGLYQLTPAKHRCLRHCRTPIGHLIHYAGFTGSTRDLRAGAHHGLFCLGCCWGLMVLMVGFGVMNVAAMVGLAGVIAIEKHWRHGERFARGVGVAALVWAAVIVVEPGAAPGLDPEGLMQMSGV